MERERDRSEGALRRALTAGLLCLAFAAPVVADLPDWPEVTRETRPWTRWWWMGSAVDRQGLTASLTAYRDAGLGGVETDHAPALPIHPGPR